MNKYVIRGFPFVLFPQPDKHIANFAVCVKGKKAIPGTIVFNPETDECFTIDDIPMDIAESLCMNGFTIQVHLEIKEQFGDDVHTHDFSVTMVKDSRYNSVLYEAPDYSTDNFKNVVNKGNHGTVKLSIKDEDAL